MPVATIELETDEERDSELKRLKEIEKMYLQLIDNNSGGSSTINLTSVSVSPSASSIIVGGTQQLTVNFTPNNATDLTGTWSSSNDSIATVNISGLVTGVAEGSATITFTSTDGSFTDTYTPTISNTVLAFPTAIGAGAYTSGGRGGQVIHVTTLDWDAAGGLKEAIQTTGARTIVFDVSGEIDASQETAFSILINGSTYDNLTIAGQSAPDGGITIITGEFMFANMDNVIIRYVRFRQQLSGTQDPLKFLGVGNFILDHCTFSHGADEGIDINN